MELTRRSLLAGAVGLVGLGRLFRSSGEPSRCRRVGGEMSINGFLLFGDGYVAGLRGLRLTYYQELRRVRDLGDMSLFVSRDAMRQAGRYEAGPARGTLEWADTVITVRAYEAFQEWLEEAATRPVAVGIATGNRQTPQDILRILDFRFLGYATDQAEDPTTWWYSPPGAKSSHHPLASRRVLAGCGSFSTLTVNGQDVVVRPDALA